MTLFVPVNKCLRFRALPHATITDAQDWINRQEVSLAWSIEPVFVAEPLRAPCLVETELRQLSPETLRECRLVRERLFSEAHQSPEI